MISKMNYLLLSTMMVAAIDSTFGRGCDCCKKLCGDKDSNGPSINTENNKTHVEYKLIQDNEIPMPVNINANIPTKEDNFIENTIDNNNFYNTNKNHNTLPENLENNNNSNLEQIIHDDEFGPKEGSEDENVKTLYFTKINKAKKDKNNIEKCFNDRWYKACKDKVLLLKVSYENTKNVLSVTGSGNNWEITGQGNVLGNTGCNPDDNKWIIVKVTTWDENSKSAGDSFIFYVDDITTIIDNHRIGGVFGNIECYRIDILAANARAVERMECMFYKVNSALEQNMEKGAGPGLIGLDKLNVENVKNIVSMFSSAIFKQATLEQLKKWRFGGKNNVEITGLFYSKVEGLNFRVLDDWSNAIHGETFYFLRCYLRLENIFVYDKEYNFTKPNWYKDIKNGK